MFPNPFDISQLDGSLAQIPVPRQFQDVHIKSDSALQIPLLTLLRTWKRHTSGHFQPRERSESKMFDMSATSFGSHNALEVNLL